MIVEGLLGTITFRFLISSWTKKVFTFLPKPSHPAECKGDFRHKRWRQEGIASVWLPLTCLQHFTLSHMTFWGRRWTSMASEEKRDHGFSVLPVWPDTESMYIGGSPCPVQRWCHGGEKWNCFESTITEIRNQEHDCRRVTWYNHVPVPYFKLDKKGIHISRFSFQCDKSNNVKIVVFCGSEGWIRWS